MRRFLLILVLLAAALASLSIISLRISYRGFPANEVFVDIPKGASTRAISGQLAKAGVIRFTWQLLLARVLHPGMRIQAGEYRFTDAASPLQVLARLSRGDVFFYELRIPEGSNVFDIASLIEQLGIMNARDFLRAVDNPALIRDLDPQAPSLEGYLFPSTYRLTRHTTALHLCHVMTAQFRRQWQSLNTAEADVHAVVTLASLVEKETAAPDERPIVASVFRNRLDRGMPLDCDPTTIYAALLDKSYRGVIHRSDLASESAYNTYRHSGLPPGPIANPGLASLRAALQPAQTDFLYFVAKPEREGHYFSRTIEEHNLRVKEYRRGLKAPSR